MSRHADDIVFPGNRKVQEEWDIRDLSMNARNTNSDWIFLN